MSLTDSDDFKNAFGSTISFIKIDQDKNELIIEFSNGYLLSVLDAGQQCCEERYMHTDDELDIHVGAVLLDAELRDGPDEPEDEWGNEEDSQFLVIKTTQGHFTIVNYNRHNGYYGGFRICAKGIYT